MKTFRWIMMPLLLGVLGLQIVRAQVIGSNIVVTVTPDHQDWNYRVGEKAHFVVNVRKSGTLLDNVAVSYEAGPVMYPNAKKSLTLKDGTMKWTGEMSSPGFYRLKVIAHVAGKDYEGLCTAAFSPEKLVPCAQEPKDFDAFWQRHWMRHERLTLILQRCCCPKDALRIRTFLKSVLIIIAVVQRFMES